MRKIRYTGKEGSKQDEKGNTRKITRSPRSQLYASYRGNQYRIPLVRASQRFQASISSRP
jgi:hypothetical protein